MLADAKSVTFAALCFCCLSSAPIRADDKDLQAQITIREMRGHLDTILAVPPQAPFFLSIDATNKGGVFGVDVSQWDFDCDCPSGCTIDWQGAIWNQGVRFVYVEAPKFVSGDTQPNAWRDKIFPNTWKALRPLHEAGLIYRGAYHWLSSDPQISGAAQAQWFVKNIGDGGDHLAYALDFEPDLIQVSKDRYDAIKAVATCETKEKDTNGQKQITYFCDRWYGQKPEVIVAKISDWLQAVEANNQKAMIYTTSKYWNTMIAGKSGDLLASRGVWLALYLDPATYPEKEKPQSTITPTNKWGLPPPRNGVSYPEGAAYSSRTNWQFEQCGQFHQTVWTCNGKPSAGPVPSKDACPMATSPVMDMSWYPSSMADFKAAFGIK
jgi:GH25 family lysozyme M1 (1,4-beta-N-acetylmuramidase)